MKRGEIMDLEDLDNLFAEPIRKDYKESKREFKKLLTEIKDIEERANGKLLFDDYQVSADHLLIKIRNIEKEFKNNSITASKVQTSRRNYEEDELINFIAKKDEMMGKIIVFVDSFNRLDYECRVIIYYSFFKNKYDEFIAQRIFVSVRTTKSLKQKAVTALMVNMTEELLMKQLKRRSGSNDSDFFYTQKNKNRKGAGNDE